MRSVYILLAFLSFCGSICYNYYTEPPPNLDLTSNTASGYLSARKQELSDSANKTQTDKTKELVKKVSQFDNHKLSLLKGYTTQYYVNQSFEEIENNYYERKDNALQQLAFFYERQSNLLNCYKDCPYKIDKESVGMFYATLMEIKHLNKELFTSEMNEMISLIEEYRNSTI